MDRLIKRTLSIASLLLVSQYGHAARVTNPARQLGSRAVPRNIPRSRVLAAAEEGGEESKPKMSLGGLFQLITMGAGAPSLGDFKEWDGNTAMFELEANNFADEDGNVRRGKYVDDGYLEPSGSDSPPSFFDNLMSGGQLQREFTDRARAADPADGD